VISDLQIVNLLIAQYQDPAKGFDVSDPGVGPSGICWSSVNVSGTTVICLRGSKTFWDWFKDFIALATPYDHETLGPTHPGFTLGMDRCWRDIKASTTGPYVIAGHSLGGGRASILTGLMLEDNVHPLSRVTFGEPKPGFSQLAQYISSVPARAYRNGDGHHHDMVTDFPLTISMEEYTHPTPLIELSATPSDQHEALFGMFKFHHISLYGAALTVQPPSL